MTVEDLAPEASGLLWTFRRPTKTDQGGEGFTLWPGPRAAEALDGWAAAAGLESGAVFRAVGRWGHVGDQALTGRQVARIYRYRAEAAGLEASRVSGHSPRAGLVTEAGRQGIPLQEVMQVSRHSDPRTALRYHRQVAARHHWVAGMAG
ncbi:MAG: hypothetical protein MI919_39865 [Holophagales bacterium]|nr:hypothetical protein [Holophagales bacterium]